MRVAIGRLDLRQPLARYQRRQHQFGHVLGKRRDG